MNEQLSKFSDLNVQIKNLGMTHPDKFWGLAIHFHFLKYISHKPCLRYISHKPIIQAFVTYMLTNIFLFILYVIVLEIVSLFLLLDCNSVLFYMLQLPQQDNSFDCGLFLLHYVELFLMDVPSNFNPLKIDIFSSFVSAKFSICFVICLCLLVVSLPFSL
jgi:uncharacterized metal-binding protein